MCPLGLQALPLKRKLKTRQQRCRNQLWHKDNTLFVVSSSGQLLLLHLCQIKPINIGLFPSGAAPATIDAASSNRSSVKYCGELMAWWGLLEKYIISQSVFHDKSVFTCSHWDQNMNSVTSDTGYNLKTTPKLQLLLKWMKEITKLHTNQIIKIINLNSWMWKRGNSCH